MTLANLFHDAAMFIALSPEDVAAVLLLSARRSYTTRRDTIRFMYQPANASLAHNRRW